MDYALYQPKLYNAESWYDGVWNEYDGYAACAYDDVELR